MSDREQFILRQSVKFDSMVRNELGMSANEALTAFSEGRLKSNKQQLQQAREEGRKEAAQEIIDELTVVIEDDLQCISCCRDFIKAKFGLEGKR